LFGFLKGFCDYYFDKDFEAKQLLIWVVIYYSVILTLFLMLWIFVVRKLSRITLTLSSDYITLENWKKTIIPWDEIDKVFIQTSKKSEQVLNIRVISQRHKSLLFGGFNEMDKIEKVIRGNIAELKIKKVEILTWYRVIIEQLLPLILVVFAVLIHRNNDFGGKILIALSCFIYGIWFIKFNPYRSSIIVPKQIGWGFSVLFFVLGILFLMFITIDKYFI
jgi:hypothetical protein